MHKIGIATANIEIGALLNLNKTFCDCEGIKLQKDLCYTTNECIVTEDKYYADFYMLTLNYCNHFIIV